MSSRTSAGASSSPFRLRSISSTTCIGASLVLVLRIDEEPPGPRDLPRRPAQPPLRIVQEALDLPVLARDARRGDARTLPDVVVVDLGHRGADPVLELCLRGAQVVALVLQGVRLGEVKLAGEDPDPAARHGVIQAEDGRTTPLDLLSG